MESWKMKCFPSYDPGWAAACCVLIAWILAASRRRFDLYPMRHCVCLCEDVQIRAVNSMIRLSYPNTSPRETLFYRISSGRHYHTSLPHPCPISLWQSSLTASCRVLSALPQLALQLSHCSLAALPGHPTQSSASMSHCQTPGITKTGTAFPHLITVC